MCDRRGDVFRGILGCVCGGECRMCVGEECGMCIEGEWPMCGMGSVLQCHVLRRSVEFVVGQCDLWG